MLDKWRKHEYPLHVLTWYNKYEILEKCLSNQRNECNKLYDIEKKDIRGRSPLHLAITLGNTSSVEVLLKHGANVNSQNAHCWTVLHEAISTGKPDLVHMCLTHYKRGAHSEQKRIDVPALLEKLRQTPDFYVEMKWEFTSWVPLMSRMCPNDTYKIWKRGANVRVDTTLLGFEGMNWIRGNRSYLFKTRDNTSIASVMELDHDLNQVHMKHFDVMTPENTAHPVRSVDDFAVSKKLEMPIANTYLDTEKIAFQRDKSGVWGFRQDKTETVNNYEAKVFNAMNVELITRTRTEHLSELDKKRYHENKEEASTGKKTLETILGVVDKEEKQFSPKSQAGPSHTKEQGGLTSGVSIEEYFNAAVTLDTKRNIGHPIEQTTKTRSFSAHVWLAETYPLSLQEQLLPVIQLMSRANAHFKRLHDFIVLQLPAGFPIKIEIPLFHVLNARITFGNIFALDTAVSGVLTTTDRPVSEPLPARPVDKNECQSPAIRRRTFNSTPKKSTPGEMVDIPLSSDKSPVNVVIKDSDGAGASSTPNSPHKMKRRCVVDASLFDIPNTYSVIGDSDEAENQYDSNTGYDEDDQLLQFALRQSLLDTGETPDMQAYTHIPNDEDRMIQRAIQESLSNTDVTQQQHYPPSSSNIETIASNTMEAVFAESKRQLAEDDRNRQAREDEILADILKLSMTDK